MTEVTSRVDSILVEHLACDAESVTDDASLIDDLGADSLDVIELVMAFEEEFGVQISDDESDGLKLVGDCHRLMEAKVGEAQAA